MDNEELKKKAFNKGLVILLILATLTIGEYFLGAVASVWWAPLIAIALLKAYLIIRDYMHVGRLFETEEVE
jgi:cytochrome c oxidase subunit IV